MVKEAVVFPPHYNLQLRKDSFSLFKDKQNGNSTIAFSRVVEHFARRQTQ